MQSVEIRILRGKLTFYEKPKEGIEMWTRWLPVKLGAEHYSITPAKMKDDHLSLVKFNQGIRFFKYLKKEGIVENKESFQKMLEKKGFPEFTQFYD